jgi:hypothetical protein
MLLKSIPSFQGMSKPKLFQVVDPNSIQMVVIVTFQRCNREIIDSQKKNLNTLLRALVDTEQIDIIFTEPQEGKGNLLK